MESLQVESGPSPAGKRGSEKRGSEIAKTGRKSLGSFAMASVAQAATGLDCVERPQGLSFNDAVLTMIINCVGAGVVLFPKIMTDVGMIIAPLLCIICALVCLECGVMITSASEMAEKFLGTPIRTYEELADFAAPKWKPVLMVTKNVAFLGFVVAYMQLIIDSISTFSPEFFTEWATALRFAVVLPIFCFCAMIKDLTQLASFGTVGIIAVMIECGCIMGGGLTLMFQGKNGSYDVGPAVDIGELPGASGKYLAIFLFCFAILGTVPTVRGQLENPSEMHGVLSNSFIKLIFINCAVMLCGYLGFGDKAGDNVIVDFAALGGWFLYVGWAGSVAVIINVLLSTPLYFFCVMSVIEDAGSGPIFTQLSVPNIIFRLAMVTVLCLIGDQLPYVGEVIGIVSSVFACFLNILFPAICHFFARRKVDTKAAHPIFRQIKYVVSILVGILVLIFGFMGSLNTLMFKLAEDGAKQECEQNADAEFDSDKFAELFKLSQDVAAACATTIVNAATDATTTTTTIIAATNAAKATVAAIVG